MSLFFVSLLLFETESEHFYLFFITLSRCRCREVKENAVCPVLPKELGITEHVVQMGSDHVLGHVYSAGRIPGGDTVTSRAELCPESKNHK